jgi:hypothetical protein
MTALQMRFVRIENRWREAPFLAIFVPFVVLALLLRVKAKPDVQHERRDIRQNA